jgi:hypothetical protein
MGRELPAYPTLFATFAEALVIVPVNDVLWMRAREDMMHTGDLAPMSPSTTPAAFIEAQLVENHPPTRRQWRMSPSRDLAHKSARRGSERCSRA